VGALLDKRARPDAPSKVSGVSGVTPLMVAAVGGKEDLARILLARGADAGLAASNGATAADFAARNGHARLAGLLQH
jgi:ankyrin repeat protein